MILLTLAEALGELIKGVVLLIWYLMAAVAYSVLLIGWLLFAVPYHLLRRVLS